LLQQVSAKKNQFRRGPDQRAQRDKGEGDLKPAAFIRVRQDEIDAEGQNQYRSCTPESSERGGQAFPDVPGAAIAIRVPAPPSPRRVVHYATQLAPVPSLPAPPPREDCRDNDRKRDGDKIRAKQNPSQFARQPA